MLFVQCEKCRAQQCEGASRSVPSFDVENNYDTLVPLTLLCLDCRGVSLEVVSGDVPVHRQQAEQQSTDTPRCCLPCSAMQ